MKKVSSFLVAIKAMSPHQAMCPEGWGSPEGVLFLTYTEVICVPLRPWDGAWESLIPGQNMGGEEGSEGA